MLETLELAYGPRTAVVWLNRPDVRNALDGAMIAELTETFTALAGDEEVLAIVLAAHGPAFCSGADLHWMQQAGGDPARHAEDARALGGLLEAVHHCPKPVIARIHGACLGGGVGLAAACDIAVAARTASFGHPETRLGLMPALVGPYVMRAIGPRAAGRWLLTGETFGAAEAWRLGLVHDLCEIDELDPRINALLGSFMLAHPDSVRATKVMVHDMSYLGLDSQDCASRHACRRGSAAGREGISAFLEDRLPGWVPELPEEQA